MSDAVAPVTSTDAAYFDALFDSADDPWQFRTRWYETRKRALTLACLPTARYGRGYEPGCANGELTAALATRCDRLLASDGAERAVALARTRLRGLDHVRVVQAWLPQDWPAGTFDLVVLSELGYYLDRDALKSLTRRLLASLSPNGTVVACHWRPPIAGCALNGDEVHAALDEQLALSRMCSVVEPDLRMDVWCTDGTSVAERERLR